MNNPSSDPDRGQVVNFRRRPGAAPPQEPEPPPIEDLSKFEQGTESESDYRHRMIVNGIALAFVVGLVAAAIWLADTMATMRKNQDCVLSGRVGCTPVDFTPQRR